MVKFQFSASDSEQEWSGFWKEKNRTSWFEDCVIVE